jgi:hypothetical protein
MRRKTRFVAGMLAVAALGLAGTQSGAMATSDTDTCSHGVVPDSSSHRWVEYLSSRESEDAHIHRYYHRVGWVGNHERERTCEH